MKSSPTLSVEIARNRLGLNDAAHEAAQPELEKVRVRKEKGSSSS